MNVPTAGLPAGVVMDLAVARKQQQSVREQGQQALQLIQAAMPPGALAPDVGTQLNIKA
jgi:hypothetical protein